MHSLPGRQVERHVYLIQRFVYRLWPDPARYIQTAEPLVQLVGRQAQQARRALDHLIGFNLSPLLWKKIQPKLSAGRVQSPALRMIVEREEEIEKFKAREYWTVEADLEKGMALMRSI